MEKYKCGVVIGRFQPFHNSHLELVKHALEQSDKVVIVLGSAFCSPNIKNPFSWEERRDMIRLCFNYETLQRLEFAPVRDYFYQDDSWKGDVKAKVQSFYDGNGPIALFGNYKDSSSSYVSWFPDWEFVSVPMKQIMDATEVRTAIFESSKEDPTKTIKWGDKTVDMPKGAWKHMVHPNVEHHISNHFIGSEKYLNLCEEYFQMKDYQRMWRNSPFPPVFVTADMVAFSEGNVLLIERGRSPGKGLYALPGGFVRSTERVIDGAIREFKEETGLAPGDILTEHVFDHPSRSLRGRTITHAFQCDIPFTLPRAGDDASRAFWFPIADLRSIESKMFEDHIHIINWFIEN